MATVNDPLEPGYVLGTLAKVKGAIETTARREEAARDARHDSILATRRSIRLEQERADAEMEGKRIGMEAELAEMEAAGQAFHERRSAWIQERYHSARQALTDRISAERDRLLGQAQGEMLKRHEELQATYDRAKQELQALREKAAGDRADANDKAAQALKYLWGFKPFFAKSMVGKGVGVSGDSEGSLRAAAEKSLEEVRGAWPAKVFRFLPLPLWWVAAVGAAVGLSGRPAEVEAWGMPAAWAVGAVTVVYLVALGMVWTKARRLALDLQRIRLAGSMAVNAMVERVEALKAEVGEESTGLRAGFSEKLRESDGDTQEKIAVGRKKLEAQWERLTEWEERLHAVRMARREAEALEQRRLFEAEKVAIAEKGDEQRVAGDAASEAEYQEVLEGLASTWTKEVTAALTPLVDGEGDRQRRFPDWRPLADGDWDPPVAAEEVVPLGTLKISRADWGVDLPTEEHFVLPEELVVPLSLGFPSHGALLLEGGAAEAADAMNALALRILASRPVGQSAFTVIDPVGLGRDFAGLMHLADYEDTLIHGRIWTQAPQIDERLGELNEHVEKVIQMYLRNEFETISEYNRSAGEMAEKYQFVFIAGFPTHFSETALQRLRSLLAGGPRCGVYPVIQMEAALQDVKLDEELRRTCLVLRQDGGVWRLAQMGGEVVLDSAPPAAWQSEWVHRIGRAHVDSNRVEVPFSAIAPQGELWTETTAEELRVPIGRAGARKLQVLAMGKGTRQHALIAGKTGSGKSTLFHVMITNLALHCSPEEVEFYLIDFKKGVEFKAYGTHRLPHARVVAVESDREFGLSVLRRVDEELRQRGEQFRACGAQDVASYRKATGKALPRTLLLIDEFQEFFTEDDGTSQEASLLLDRIVRQGRAFGIHVILGSQTLGGAYTLARATLGQMVIRIALQCNEADAYLIMDDDNPAPRLLTRPGEGIYNDHAGAVANNSPFQTVWLSEEERGKRLEAVAEMARERGCSLPLPVVYEGNAPAELSENPRWQEAMAQSPREAPEVSRVWLGAPNAIKGPTEVKFPAQSGANLLAVGQGEERMKALLESVLRSLSALHTPESARWVILDPEGPDGELGRLAAALPQAVEVWTPTNLEKGMAALQARLEAGTEEEVFVLVRDVQRFKGLREEDEFRFSFDDDSSGAVNTAKVFQSLISEGPAAGIHLIVTADAWSHVSRWIPRKLLSDFRMRVLFQMSAADSSAMIDSPIASKLGLHRGVLYDEAMATVETFRPYARVR